MSFAKIGFNDWKHNESIHKHETSKSHCQAAQLYVRRIAELGNVKSLLTKQLNEEKQYWRNILKRVFDAVCFLAVRGLPFRGSNGQIGNTHNGNYLGIIELLAKYDTILRSHIDNYANKGKGHVSYLSPNVAMEFVHLIATEVKTVIKVEIYSSKYYALIVDSTPDNSHVDQLTVIIRYVDAKGIAKEPFLEFLKETGHKGCEMEDAVIKFLVDNNFTIIDCRGQSYDTAANMSGKYSGLQTRIKQYSPLAVYIPCGGHVLNLNLCHTVEKNVEAAKFFMFVQNVYVFFSGSTKRWNLLIKHLEDGLRSRNNKDERLLVPKRLSDTRWSCRVDACRSLKAGYRSYISALDEIANDKDEKQVRSCLQQELLRLSF